MTALSQLVGWILAGFYSLVPNYGVAIILLGLTFMILVAPLTLKSTRSMLAMQKLQPKMKQLQQQHKNDRLALNQALTQLYKEEGVSPFGACIPTLIPLPLFYVLYRVIVGLGNKAKHCVGTRCADPLYLSHKTRMWQNLYKTAPAGKGAQIHAFGINLATSAWTAITKHLGAVELFGSLLLLLIMIGANFYQQLQIMNLNPMARQNQMNQQMQIMRFFPIIFGLICVRLASGLVLYYAVSALFRVGQQWLMYRLDPKVKALVARDDRDIEVMEARLEDEERRPVRKALTGPKDAASKPVGNAKGSPQRPGAARPRPPARQTGTAREASNGNGQGPGKPQRRYASAQSGAQRNRNRRRRSK
ncbi:MAG TPA: YidC/Oxa1 family membrane protein insertase [Acidimicrobiales bacterium]|nr:YidC/Oxa1 family membrane protein insertase [Acidimicrobiales bacterium]HUB69228.1 YidC/Oxa1 family membrane protein insertase [Acidimicrobiales bacterium]